MTPEPLLRQRVNGYEIPVSPCNSAVTSLTCGPDGYVIGASSGAERAHLFVFDNIANRRVALLRTLDEPCTVHHSLVFDQAKHLYLGTMPPLDAMERVAWGKSYAGGHLYRFSVSTNVAKNEEGAETTIFAGSPLEDCGIPVPGEGIQHLVFSALHRRIYGLTCPGAHLFYFDLNDGSLHDKGRLLGNEVPSFFSEHLRPRALVEDGQGNIYCTGAGGYFSRYDPSTDEVVRLSLRTPGMRVRQEWDTVESFCRLPQGDIYGGTADGYLFRFRPQEGTLVNLGKPSIEKRIRSIVCGQGDMLYGIAGDFRGAAHIFRYDLRSGGYHDLGMLSYIPVEDSSPWTAYHIAVMISDRQGVLYLGENDITSHLFVFFP